MRTLMVIGTLLLVIGAVVLFRVFVVTPGPELAATLGEDMARSEGAEFAHVWAVLAGLTLAAGGACVGIGMNHWRQGRARTIQPPPV
jgi:hypothetical protein